MSWFGFAMKADIISGMASPSGSEIELMASARRAASRLVEQLQKTETEWTARADRPKWAAGEQLLSQVRASAEAVARQINLSSNADHS